MININFNSSIYIWISPTYKFLYVGQTNNKLGIIARAYQHINIDGTLYQRVEERIGIELYKVEDLKLLNFPLPNEAKYNRNESIYRLAVEYLTQKFILEQRDSFDIKFKVISNVKSNDLVKNTEVIDIAKQIILKATKSINNIEKL